MAATLVGSKNQEVSRGQGPQTAQEQGAVFEFSQSLDEKGAMVAYRG